MSRHGDSGMAEYLPSVVALVLALVFSVGSAPSLRTAGAMPAADAPASTADVRRPADLTRTAHGGVTVPLHVAAEALPGGDTPPRRSGAQRTPVRHKHNGATASEVASFVLRRSPERTRASHGLLRRALARAGRISDPPTGPPVVPV